MINFSILIGLFLLVYVVIGLLMASMVDDKMPNKTILKWAIAWPFIFYKKED